MNAYVRCALCILCALRVLFWPTGIILWPSLYTDTGTGTRVRTRVRTGNWYVMCLCHRMDISIIRCNNIAIFQYNTYRYRVNIGGATLFFGIFCMDFYIFKYYLGKSNFAIFFH